MRQVAIAVRDLCKVYPGGVNAVSGISLDIFQGEMLAIMGKSGSGKSTLLNMIGSLDSPQSGSVSYHGTDLRSVRDLAKFRLEQIGFVFQLHYLLPHLTLLDNVALPLFGHSHAHTRAKEALTESRALLIAFTMCRVRSAAANASARLSRARSSIGLACCWRTNPQATWNSANRRSPA